MAFLEISEVEHLKSKIESDAQTLKRIYKSKNTKFHQRNVDHNRLEEFLKDGWEEHGKPLKTKTSVRKAKSHDEQFEDDIWCQAYKLGFNSLNCNRDFHLPFGKNSEEKKQIDVVAVNEDAILVIECKSSQKPKGAPSFKTEFEALRQRIDGHKKALVQMFGKEKRIKYIFATRNLRMNPNGADALRLKEAGGFLYNDNTYKYINRLILHYKDAAKFQFLAMIFKGQSVKDKKISVPAIEGKMGTKTYYMFSLEPRLLLKLGFVLHRTSANEAEMPTYQRLLVPSRLKGIGKFIQGGGYFPNSIIINFNETKRQKIEFEATSRGDDTNSRSGTLKIPNAYAIAYIIDGQHRIFGYSQSDFMDNNTIPVVAFKGLEPNEQLEMFMDINQNQKAVSPTLRITLEEDLYWNSPRLDSRIKALRSSIISMLGEDSSSPLNGKISLGEDKELLSSKPFYSALTHCGLIPEAKGNKFTYEGQNLSLYDVRNENYKDEMLSTRSRVVALIKSSYELAEISFANKNEALILINSNRGSFAFVSIIGSLSCFVNKTSSIMLSSPDEERANKIEKYLLALFAGLKDLDNNETKHLKEKLGSQADTLWLRHFQKLIHNKFSEYNPPELVDWEERQDKELQSVGREFGTDIEKHIKKKVLYNLDAFFGENIILEIGAIHRDCSKRASEEMENNYKQGLPKREIDWTEKFTLNDYLKIIEKYWAKEPENKTDIFNTFEEYYAIDLGDGFKSKKEKLKWYSKFNALRNLWAHEASNEKGLNRDEVDFLRIVYERITQIDD